MSKKSTATPPVSEEVFPALQKAFEDFQIRADKLAQAYTAMQADFRKLNIELDTKNKELADSLRKQAEVQTHLNSILESMNNGVVGVDIVGTVTYFNRAAAEITGRTPERTLGRNYEELFIDKGQSELSLLQVLRSGQEHKHAEKVFWHSDGHPVPVSFQTAMLRDPGGNLLGAVEVFSDVSRIKALEEEMQRTRTMAALGELSATVAHEIRNPLGAMGVWAGLLDRDIAPEDARKRTVRKIIEGLGRLNRIVSNLLVYTRPVKAQFRKLDLAETMNELIDFVQIEIERQNLAITVTKAWDESAPVLVTADPEKLQQVVMNLCLNAIDAMPQGGTLTVHIDKPGTGQADYVCFRIADTGIGIELERIAKLFDPFHTTKMNGTGLGLAIVKKLVESHAGYIDVYSEVGKGTTMSVFLPRAESLP